MVDEACVTLVWAVQGGQWDQRHSHTATPSPLVAMKKFPDCYLSSFDTVCINVQGAVCNKNNYGLLGASQWHQKQHCALVRAQPAL